MVTKWVLVFFLFSFNYTGFKSYATVEVAAVTVQGSVKATKLHTISKVAKKYVTTTTTTQREREREHLNSKLVLLRLCCAFRYFGCFDPATAARFTNNNANVLSSLVSCASTLTGTMATPNNILPVCLPIKPSSPFRQLTPRQATPPSLTVPSQLSSTGLHCFLVYGVATKLHSVTEPSGRYGVKHSSWFCQKIQETK